MNILVFSWRDPKHPNAGGAEQVMHEHMKGWVEARHKVTLFSSKPKGLESEEVLDGVKIIREGLQYLGVQIAGFLFYLKNKDKFDFVVDQFHGIPFFTPLYVRKKKVAVIQEATKEVWFLNELPFPVNVFIGIIGYIFEPLVFFFYKNTPFITGSNSAKEDLAAFGIPEKNITVIPHGVLVKTPKEKFPKEKRKTVVYLGALARDKGIEDAIAAFGQINKKDRNFRFWVVGRAAPTYQLKLDSLVLKAGLKGKVKFFGFVSEEKKFELLARAHLLINPSVREGWGLVNIEANAVGTPVVAYRSPGLVDSVKDGVSGILCSKNTPEELSQNILKILKDQSLYKKLKKGAISWSKNFSWDKSKKISLGLIEKVVQENP